MMAAQIFRLPIYRAHNMSKALHKGRIKSLFAGRSEPLASAILYERYADPSQILLDGEAPRPSKKLKQDTGLDQPPATAAEITQQEGKKKKRKKQQKNSEDKTLVSGPGNATEAQQIRSILGMRSTTTVGAASFCSTIIIHGVGFSAKEGNKAAVEDAIESFGFGFKVTKATAAEQETLGNGDVMQPAASLSRDGQNSGKEAVDTQLQSSPGGEAADGAHVARRVFVGGMPFSYEEEDVRDYWNYCGEIEAMDLMRFPDTGRFKGIAFITFAEEEGYRAALKCDGVMIDAQQIRAQPCVSAGPRKGGRGRQSTPGRMQNGGRHSREPRDAAPKTPGYLVAYVGNVAFEASDAEVRAVFDGCAVTKVRIHTDKDTGQPKGFAHVHFATEADLDRAMERDGTSLMGRPIRVGYAQPKKT